jgi:hypothetical protein
MNAWKNVLLPALSLVVMAFSPLGAAHAQVKVTAATPSSTVQGTVSLDVIVSGSGFDSTSSAQFFVTGTTNPGGITVRKTTFRNSREVVATIDVADFAVIAGFDIQVTLSSGRKGKGTTLFSVIATTANDPCAAPGLDFPAFVYWKSAGTTLQSFVADATGVCSRPLYLATEGYSPYGTSSFSFPVDGSTNRGRLVWLEGDQVVGGDFTVSGTTVTVGPRRAILSPVACCAVDLSSDGRHLYVSTASNTLEKVAVADTLIRSHVRTMVDDGWFVDASVDGNETAIYVEERRWINGQTFSRILGVDLDTLASTLLVPDNLNRLWPAADTESNRFAYSYYVPGSDNCHLLEILDGQTGARISYGTPRYGRDWSWFAGKVLGFGYSVSSSKRGLRCQSKDMVTEVDPLTSAERDLVRGYYPDGR